MPQFGKRRALGQHFLRDKNIARIIAETAVREAAERKCVALLEIGPGKGAITLPLQDSLAANSAAPKKMILAERDRLLVEYWRKQPAPPFPRSIEEGDFLDLPEERWLSETPLAVASNLPYSAGTAIVTRLARHPSKIPVMVLMFQAEVARRLRAQPDSKEWGSLSVWIQNRWNVRKLVAVAPGAFSPPPDVDSEVVVLTPKATPEVEVAPNDEAEARWEALLKNAFAHRRKMLRSGFPPSGPWRNALERSGVDGTKRAEALTWDEWRSLYAQLR